MPENLFGINALRNLKTWIFLLVGGAFVGFGTRYAGGCKLLGMQLVACK